MKRSHWAPLALLVALEATACTAHVPPSEPHTTVGTVLPIRREPTMTGTIVSIPTPGSVTLVDVWSTTCAPCLATMPEIEAMWRAHKGAGLRVIGVAVDDNPGLVDKKVRELGITYPIVMDPSGILRGALRVTELPGAFVVDRTGKVRVYREGGDGSDRRALRDAVEALLAEEKK